MTPVTDQPRKIAGRESDSRFSSRKRKQGKRGRRRDLRAAAGAETSYLLSLRAR